jgi:hypothetical protein
MFDNLDEVRVSIEHDLQVDETNTSSLGSERILSKAGKVASSMASIFNEVN